MIVINIINLDDGSLSDYCKRINSPLPDKSMMSGLVLRHYNKNFSDSDNNSDI